MKKSGRFCGPRRQKQNVEVCGFRLSDRCRKREEQDTVKSRRTTSALRENLCEPRSGCISPDREEALIISPAADTSAWCILGRRDFKPVPLPRRRCQNP